VTPRELALAYALDIVAGDPEWFPHPVRLFGAIIERGDRWLRRFGGGPAAETLAGAALTGVVVSLAWISGRPNHKAWRVLLAWTTLATHSLLKEAAAVIRALECGNIDLARIMLARIVGRDTGQLDESEIARAVIETLAESACDGIVAPLFCLALGGIPCAMAYKALSTLDSMIGHPEPPYRYFGRIAARLDDGANLVPSRLTALAIAASAGVRACRSLRIWLRDGGKHASPNAGESEAAMAGALGVRLGGTNFYDGRPRNAPLLYEEGRPATVSDARRALSIVATVSGIAFGIALLFLVQRRPRP
jgi:adenosylcobinamide-phosphate synthase